MNFNRITQLVALKVSAVLAIACVLTSPVHAQSANRTVIDNKIGTIFDGPSGYSWSQAGAYVGLITSSFFDDMSPDAIKVLHGRFSNFGPSDNGSLSHFPWNQFLAYEASEIAAGRAPLRVTATYQGVKRPVVLSWSLGLSGTRPTRSQSEWRYVVNFGNPRFIDFWVQNYARSIVLAGYGNGPLQNKWIGLDNSAFTPLVFGVIDNSGNFVADVPWDQPFPQNEDQMLDAVKAFFQGVKQRDPSIRLMPNIGTMKWSRFNEVFGEAHGLMIEDLVYAPSTSVFLRNKYYDIWQAMYWANSQGRVTIMRTVVPNDTQRRVYAFAAAKLMWGPNSFYAPRVEGTHTAQSPATYAQWDADLGEPAGPLESQQMGTQPGFRLYWREYEGGRVYMNITGSTQTIPVPAGWRDRNGNSVSSISIADQSGDFILNHSAHKAGQPRINPRFAGTASTPINVTMSNSPGTSGTIRYTTNGSTPTPSSPIYNGGISLTAGALIRAITTQSGMDPSFDTEANYGNSSSSLPYVEFTTTQASGSAGNFSPTVVLSATASSPVTVDYSATRVGQSTVTGSITVPAGQQTNSFSLSVQSGATVTLSSPSGALLGNKSVLTIEVTGGNENLPWTEFTVTSMSGSAGNFTPTVTLSAPSSQTVSVPYTATRNGSTVGTGVVTIPAGQQSSSFTINIPSTTTLTLSNPVGAKLASKSSMLITITGDNGPLPWVEFTVTSMSGTGGNYTPTVVLSAPSSQTVSVPYVATRNGSTVGTGVVTIPAGQQSSSFTINVPSTTTLTLSNPAGAQLASKSTLLITISGSSASLPWLEFTVTSLSGSAGNYQPTLVLSAPAAQNISVTSTAVRGGSIVQVDTVTIPAGQKSTTFSINIPSTTTLTLSNPVGAKLANKSSLTITVASQAATLPWLELSSVFDNRATSGTFTPMVVMSEARSSSTTVSYTAVRQGQSNLTGTVTVPAGQQTATFAISVQTFAALTLSNPVGAQLANKSTEYLLVGSLPWLEFTTMSLSGSSSTFNPMLALSAAQPYPITVTYTAVRQGQSNITETVTVPAGQQYFPLSISVQTGATLTLSDPVGARLAKKSTLTITRN